MVAEKPLSFAQKLRNIGITKSHAYMLARGDRLPSLPLALKIHSELGVKLGPIAAATDAEVKTLRAMTSRDAAA